MPHPLMLVSTAVLGAALLTGQAPTFVQKPGVVRFAAEGVPQLLTALPTTALGKLLAEPSIAEACANALRRYRERSAQRDALLAAVHDRATELHPWLVSRLPELLLWQVLRSLDLQDCRSIEYAALQSADTDFDLHETLLLRCQPRAEGRWDATLDRIVGSLAGPHWFRSPEAKFAGMPMAAFTTTDPSGQASPHDPRLGEFEAEAWLLHLPGAFVVGRGPAAACGDLGPPPPAAPPQLLAHIDTATYVAVFQAQMAGLPIELRALGIDGLQSAQWRLQFHGAQILDELELQLGDTPSGLIGALLTGTAALPSQDLPNGALAQVRFAIDLRLLLETLPPLPGVGLRGNVGDDLLKACTGGIALGVCAPAPGGVLPRVFLSLGIHDEQALDRVLQALPAEMQQPPVTYEGVACIPLRVPDLPAGMQPVLCRRDGVLHIAESGLSMRAFLKAQPGGAGAMDVGDAPPPSAGDEVLPTFDLRADEAALYRAFHRHWLPLCKLLPGNAIDRALLTAAEMPEPDDIAPLLGKTRGVLVRNGKRYTFRQLGNLGGLHTAALAMAFGPLLSATFQQDHFEMLLVHNLAAQQLQRVWPKFEAFQRAKGRWPQDLAELFAAHPELPADALLLPGEPNSEPVALAAGDARAVRSSFRYFPVPIALDLRGEAHRLLLVAITPRLWGRPMLSDIGAVPDVDGDESTRPIDRFGK